MNDIKSGNDQKIFRVSACNFYETIFDTDDLSTVRGGSMMLLEFPNVLFKKINEDDRIKIECLAKGASEFLFTISGLDDMVNSIIEDFFKSEIYQHFTFVHGVALLSDKMSFKSALDSVVRQCNLQQYRQPTVKDYEAGGVVCDFTGVLPAAPGKQERNRPVSASVKLRREKGRDAKQSFYKKELGCTPAGLIDFAREFSDLVLNAPENKCLPESIKGKMAVLYLDGNSFRKIREKHSDTSGAYSAFSNEIIENRRKLLSNVVDWVISCPEMTRPGRRDEADGPCLRLETLLWGGDEVMWVLPAFKAWEFMKVVQRNLNDKSIWGEELTHSCGLLIAPYKAPIKDLRALVNSLGDVAKECPNGRKMNGVQIEFIKGFDLPGLSAGCLRKEFLNGDDDHHAFQLDGSRWDEIDKAMQDIKKAVPRSALHRVYQQAARDDLHRPANAVQSRDFVSEKLDRIETVNGQPLDEELRKYLTDGFPGAQDAAARYPLVPLRQVLQFWDLVPENNGGAK